MNFIYIIVAIPLFILGVALIVQGIWAIQQARFEKEVRVLKDKILNNERFDNERLRKFLREKNIISN